MKRSIFLSIILCLGLICSNQSFSLSLSNNKVKIGLMITGLALTQISHNCTLCKDIETNLNLIDEYLRTQNFDAIKKLDINIIRSEKKLAGENGCLTKKEAIFYANYLGGALSLFIGTKIIYDFFK